MYLCVKLHEVDYRGMLPVISIIYLHCSLIFPVTGLCFVKQVRKGKSDSIIQVVSQPRLSSGVPHARSLSIPIVLPLTSGLRSPSPDVMETTPRQDTSDSSSQVVHLDISLSGSTDGLSRSVYLCSLT